TTRSKNCQPRIDSDFLPMAVRGLSGSRNEFGVSRLTAVRIEQPLSRKHLLHYRPTARTGTLLTQRVDDAFRALAVTLGGDPGAHVAGRHGMPTSRLECA